VSQHPDWLTPNMLGCSLSHIKAYQTVIDQGLDYAFIFEDDVVLGAGLQPLMAQIAAKASGNSATLLYYQCWDAITLSQQKGIALGGNYRQYEVTNQYRFISTAGYFITRDACQTMLQKTLPLHVGPDSWKYFCECGALQQLNMVYPMPVQTFEFQSTISNVLEMKNASPLGKLIALVEKYKVPLLHQLLQRRRRANKQDLQKITLVP
jgi:GR25 family glycosyltransferase involved in LPS biosynthesis